MLQPHPQTHWKRGRLDTISASFSKLSSFKILILGSFKIFGPRYSKFWSLSILRNKNALISLHRSGPFNCQWLNLIKFFELYSSWIFFSFLSHAINIYLTTKYSQGEKLYPADPKKRAIIHERLFFESCVLDGATKPYIVSQNIFKINSAMA